MLRATDRHGNSEYAWKTMPRSAPGPIDEVAVDAHLARRRTLEAADDVEQRRLAAAGRAEQADELAVADVQVDVVEGDDVRRPLRNSRPTPRTVTLAGATAAAIGVPAAATVTAVPTATSRCAASAAAGR